MDVMMEVEEDNESQDIYLVEEDGTLTRIDRNSVYFEENEEMVETDENQNNDQIEIIIEQMDQSEASSSSSTASFKLPNTGQYICDKCGKIFSQKSGLTKHLEIHADYKPFRCYIQNCGTEFCGTSSFKRHFDKIHLNPTRKDHVNGVEYSLNRAREEAKNYYEQHQQSSSSSNSIDAPPARERNFPCRKGCSKSFYEGKVRNEHEKLHDTFRQYKCELCDYFAVHSSSMARHYRSCHTEAVYDSNNCKQQKPKETQATVTNKETFPCPHCHQIYIFQFQLDKHLPTHNRHLCSVCSKSFMSRKYVESHIQVVHQNRKNFRCDFVLENGKMCGKQYGYATLLRFHKRTVHQRERYKCGVCQQIFAWPTSLARHKKQHVQFIPVKCSCCVDRTFYTARAFKSHSTIRQKKTGEFRRMGIAKFTGPKRQRITDLRKKCNKIVKQKRQDRTEEYKTKKVRLLVWPCNHHDDVQKFDTTECSTTVSVQTKCTKMAFCWTTLEFEQMRIVALYDAMLGLGGCISINHHHLDDKHDMDVERATFILECENKTIVLAVKRLFTKFIDSSNLTHVARFFPLFEFGTSALKDVARIIASFDLSAETEEEILVRITHAMNVRVPQGRQLCRDLPQIIFEAGMFRFRPQIRAPRFSTRRILLPPHQYYAHL